LGNINGVALRVSMQDEMLNKKAVQFLFILSAINYQKRNT